MFNWHQHLATQILKSEYHTTEHIIERAFCLDVIEGETYRYDTERLGWWWRMTFNWIATPGSNEEQHANIKAALQRFSWACSKITLPIIAKERQLPHSQRLAQLSYQARLKLAEAQQGGISLRKLAWRLDCLEHLFAARLLEVLEMEGLTPEDRTDRADDLIASYYAALCEILNCFPCHRRAT